MSEINLLGRLTKDPEFRQNRNESVSMFLSIADNWRENRGGQWQDGSAFYNAIVYCKDAEAYARAYEIYNGRKGELVYISGALRPKASTQSGGQGMLLAIEFARVTPTWKTARQAQPAQPASPQPQPQPQPQAPAPAAQGFAPPPPAQEAPAQPAPSGAGMLPPPPPLTG
jgi:single-stranded DNA-binding protein